MTTILRAVSGLIGWALSFSLIYALQGLVCSPRFAPFAAREILIGTWLLCLAALGWLAFLLRPSTPRPSLADWLGFVLAVTGLVSTLFTGFPVLFATTCA